MSTRYWNNEFQLFYNPTNGIDIDGAWIDMNEPASVCVIFSSALLLHFLTPFLLNSFAILHARIPFSKPSTRNYLHLALHSLLIPTRRYLSMAQTIPREIMF
jgi:hypothetical protein